MSMLALDDRDGYIWFNGKMIPWRDAKIHVLTHGLHYASCVFEGERAYNGKIFKSKEHTTRLFRSAEIMNIKIDFTKEEIEAAKVETLKANNLTNAYIRPLVWKGSETLGVSAKNNKTNVAIACWDWPSYFSPEKREKGIRMSISKWRKPMPNTAPWESKAAGLYMINTMAKDEASQRGYDDAIMLDYRGNVVEGTGANVFAIKDGTLHTPNPDCFLNGITRQTILEIAEDLNIPVKLCYFTPEELADFDEFFITGTAAEVTAVGEIDDYKFTVGEVTRKIREAYETRVGR